MLLHLHVENLALIDKISIDLEDHLNILTGETGAGKSIILGSIEAALGGKITKDRIRKGADYGYVELVFCSQKEEVKAFFEREDLPFEEDGTIIISRKITANRSLSKINGVTVILSKIKELAEQLIDIHGQNEHQSLRNQKKHLEILDDYGRNDLAKIKEQVSKQFKSYKIQKEELEKLSMNEEERRREISFLEYEIQEINDAHLANDEEEKLEKEHKKLSHAKLLLETLGQIYGKTGYEQDMGGGNQIGSALRELGRVSEYDEEIKEFYDILQHVDSLLNDFNRSISDYISDICVEEERLVEVEERLDLIYRLKNKYGNSVEDILSYAKKQEAKLEQLLHYEEYKNKKEKELEEIEKQLKESSVKLSTMRKKLAKKLSSYIQDALLDLNFLDVTFDIAFTEKETYSADGIDQICYMITTNPGEPLKPVADVASGGELSRIMLAIKSVLADVDGTDTLIFDEIDTGISGRTAQMVAQKLRWIGKKHQVISITHLPQIAAMADVHYKIEKQAEKDCTTTSIYALDEEQSVTELARLLGGVEITNTVMENAREMKKMADSV